MLNTNSMIVASAMQLGSIRLVRISYMGLEGGLINRCGLARACGSTGGFLGSAEVFIWMESTILVCGRKGCVRGSELRYRRVGKLGKACGRREYIKVGKTMVGMVENFRLALKFLSY